MNNKYTIAILNNKKHKTSSFNISKSALIIIFCLFFGFIAYSLNIIYKYNSSALQIQSQKLNKLEPQFNLLLNRLISDSLINENMLKEYDLNDEYNEISSNMPIYAPVEGFVSNGLNEATSHQGIDIACPMNAEVKATQKGFVVFAGYIKNYGNTIILSHPNQYFSLYAHLNKNLVSSKKYVQENQIIGLAGKSGNSDGPHLHFEIWKNDNIIDPRNLIEEYRKKDVSVR